MDNRRRPGAMTPLWVISLFLSLTEVVLGVAATQTTGKVQIALVAFVIAFPIAVASAFFITLWSRPRFYMPQGTMARFVPQSLLQHFKTRSLRVVSLLASGKLSKLTYRQIKW